MFDTDEEIEAYIAQLGGGVDEFRQLIGLGRINGVRQQRGRDYLQRRDEREAAEAARRQLEASERSAAAAEASALEAAAQSKLAKRSALIAIISCIVTVAIGIATIIATLLAK